MLNLQLFYYPSVSILYTFIVLRCQDMIRSNIYLNITYFDFSLSRPQTQGLLLALCWDTICSDIKWNRTGHRKVKQFTYNTDTWISISSDLEYGKLFILKKYLATEGWWGRKEYELKWSEIIKTGIQSYIILKG